MRQAESLGAGNKPAMQSFMVALCPQQPRVGPQCVWVPALVKAKPSPGVQSGCLLWSDTAVSPGTAHPIGPKCWGIAPFWVKPGRSSGGTAGVSAQCHRCTG